MSEFYGGSAVTPMLVPDLSQTNPNRSDFVKNKHILANAIKNSASGVGAIRLDDVSPLEQEISVSVDVAGATIERYGKNLNPTPNPTPSNTYGNSLGQCAFLPKGIYTISATMTGAENWYFMYSLFDKEGNRITEAEENSGVGASIHLKSLTTGTGLYFNQKGYYIWGGKRTHTSETIEIDDDYYLGFSNSAMTSAIISNAQVEIGETATEYEPYVEPTTYTADENGKVSGIIGNGENMTLVADSSTIISAEYSMDTKKYIDNKFAELQALILEV